MINYRVPRPTLFALQNRSALAVCSGAHQAASFRCRPLPDVWIFVSPLWMFLHV